MNNIRNIFFGIAGVSVVYSILHNAIQQPDSKCQLFPTDKYDEFILSCSSENQQQRVYLKNWQKRTIKNKLYCPPEPFFSVYLLDENDELFLCKQKNIGYPLELWCEKTFISFFNIDCGNAYSKEKQLSADHILPKKAADNTMIYSSSPDTVKQETAFHHNGHLDERSYGHYNPNVKWFNYIPNFYIVGLIIFAFFFGAVLASCVVITCLFCKLGHFSQMRKYTDNLYTSTNNGTNVTNTNSLLNNVDTV